MSPLRFAYKKIKNYRKKYPRLFYILLIGSFIQTLGWGLIFPFFTLFLRQRLDVSMSIIGTTLAIFSLGNMIGQHLAGHIADRVGRRPVILVSTFTHGLMMFLLIPGKTILYFNILGFVLGLFETAFIPAVNAMISDIVISKERTEAYSIMRIVRNLGVVFGPAVGGFIASSSYIALLSVAGILFIVYFFIALFFVKETFVKEENIEYTGYKVVLKDRIFMQFLVATIFTFIVVYQMSSTLPVYIKEIGGYSEKFFGYLFSFNAALVVFLQIPIAKAVKKLDISKVLASGAILYGIGFAIFTFAFSKTTFFLAMGVLTLGEMVMSPTLITTVSLLSPKAHRGKYMSAFSQTYTGISAFISPPLGGLAYDNLKRKMWLAGFVLTSISSIIFLAIGKNKEYEKVKKRMAEGAGL